MKKSSKIFFSIVMIAAASLFVANNKNNKIDFISENVEALSSQHKVWYDCWYGGSSSECRHLAYDSEKECYMSEWAWAPWDDEEVKCWRMVDDEG